MGVCVCRKVLVMKSGLYAAIVGAAFVAAGGVAFAAVYSGAAAAAGRIGGEWLFDVYKADGL